MATGLEVLGAVAASLELAWRFEKWCSALGIVDIIAVQQKHPNHWNTTPEFLRFEEALTMQLRLKNELLAPVILATLVNMQEKLEEANATLGRLEKQSRWSRLVKTRQASDNNDSTSQIKKGSGQSSAFRWLTVDKKKLFVILDGVEKNNNRLMQLLEPVLQTQVKRRTDMVILDNVDQGTANVLPEDSDLRVLANIKQWHISFKKGTLPLGAARSLSTLNGQRVMVEWRYCSSETTTRRDPVRRLGGLVSLLNRKRLYERFLTLPCLRGLVIDSSNSRIGIVFSLDDVTDGTSIKSLQDVVRRVATPLPVGQRFKLARDIATALHHLHSVRWLHKSIRSDNILCFSPMIKNLLDSEAASTVAWSKAKLLAPKRPGSPSTANVGAPVDNAETLPLLTKGPNPLPHFYLVGWDLSRPEHASELSETLSISTAGYRSRRDAIRMYSYPDTYAELTTKQQYRPEYDIYSLGLVLLEIGLWRTIDTIWKQSPADAAFRVLVRTEYCDRLLGKMGEVYWRVVQRCLSNDFGAEKGSADNGDFSLQESFEKNVVCELESCSA
ncbi:hypothetical protein V8F06_007662 [Rhypophila decipiens]